MKKGKTIKNDIINILILTIIFFCIIFLVLKNKYIWGSTLDWVEQHSVIPEYFRTLFKSTYNLFPNLALNLGAGQNIYNYAYYGLFNPLIMLSYILPNIDMKIYIIITTLLSIYVSVVLFYYLLKTNNFNSKLSFIGTLIFMCASPLLFHSHRHIMFVNYMPYLILGLISVDKYYKNNNRYLMPICIFLIILTSFYYSIPSILCILIYGMYKYIEKNKKITIKSFIVEGYNFLIPIIVGIIMSSFLILPEFSAIIDGRMSSPLKIDLFKLLIPSANISYIVYYSYGLGLTSIGVISLISIFFDKKREDKFLGIILSLFIIFPIFNFILNGFMYIDAKILIPLLPMYALVITKFIKKLFENNSNIYKIITITIIISLISLFTKTYKYEYYFYELLLTILIIAISYKYKLKYLFTIYIIIITILFSIISNSVENFVLKDDNIYTNDKIQESLVKDITDSDKSMYKIASLIDTKHTSNSIFNNINMYQNYIYSSIYNSTYNKFYYDIFNNEMQSRNRVLTTASNNILFHTFMSNKYILSEEDNLIGYSKINEKDNIKVLKNENVLPYMYVSYNTFNEDVFNTKRFPYSLEILLNNTVVKSGKNNDYNSKIRKFNIDKYDYENIDIKKSNDTYDIEANENSIINIELPEQVKNKIIMISFDMNKLQSCSVGDQAIIINDSINKLSCKEWKYYNGNTTFTYVISKKYISNLNISFYEGSYNINNINLYYLDYNDIKNINSKITSASIDKEKTKGDYIYASVDTLENGYFTTSIPYQKGFEIFVDGELYNYEKINGGFIGFPITKGNHSIVFKYTAPLKEVGSFMSIFGFATLVGLIYFSKSNKRINKK